MTVIVAEDEILVRMLAADMLAEAGFGVIEAGNADEAIAALQAHAGTVALLVTDVYMPGELTGLELARLVRERWPEVAIIVTSGDSKPRPADLPSGGRFVAKPYHINALVAHAHALTSA